LNGKKQSKIFITFSGLIQKKNQTIFFWFGVTNKTTTNSNNFSGFLRIFKKNFIADKQHNFFYVFPFCENCTHVIIQRQQLFVQNNKALEQAQKNSTQKIMD
jgi:hypothetical protein